MTAEGISLRTLPDIGPDVRAEIASDIQKLESLNADTTKALFSSVLSFLGDPLKINLMETVDKMAGDTKVDQKSLRDGTRALFRVAEGGVRRGASSDDIRRDLEAVGLSKDCAMAAAGVWVGDMPRAASRAAATGVPGAGERLVDFQWTFGVAVATDEVLRLGETFVRLKLTLGRTAPGASDEETLRTVWMELSIPAFYDMLAELERARSVSELLGGVHGDDEDDHDEE